MVKKNKFFIIISSIFVIVILLPKLLHYIYLFNLKITSGDIHIDTINLMGLIIFLFISIFFGILGFKLADKKNRNKCIWTSLCLLFNLWAYLFLYYYLPEKKNKGEEDELKEQQI